MLKAIAPALRTRFVTTPIVAETVAEAFEASGNLTRARSLYQAALRSQDATGDLFAASWLF